MSKATIDDDSLIEELKKYGETNFCTDKKKKSIQRDAATGKVILTNQQREILTKKLNHYKAKEKVNLNPSRAYTSQLNKSERTMVTTSRESSNVYTRSLHRNDDDDEDDANDDDDDDIYYNRVDKKSESSESESQQDDIIEIDNFNRLDDSPDYSLKTKAFRNTVNQPHQPHQPSYQPHYQQYNTPPSLQRESSNISFKFKLYLINFNLNLNNNNKKIMKD
jgi:hypothetical protein